MIISQKFHRYVFYERTFKIFLLVFLLLNIVMVYQFHLKRSKKELLQRAKANQQLVDQIPVMENVIAEKLLALMPPPPEPEIVEEEVVKPVTEPEPPPPPPVVEEEIMLEGIVFKEGSSYAFLDGNLYKVGDVISKYIIIKIDKNQVKLKDQGSQNIRVLKMHDGDLILPGPSENWAEDSPIMMR
jgi:hypothetical protein